MVTAIGIICDSKYKMDFQGLAYFYFMIIDFAICAVFINIFG